VNGRCLPSQHGLHLISGFDSLDDRKHEIEMLLVASPCLCELRDKARKGVVLGIFYGQKSANNSWYHAALAETWTASKKDFWLF
jgi:hypothetical protein